LNLPEDFIVLTLHRPYNVDSPSNLRDIVNKLSELNQTIVFPVHPRTKHVLESQQIKLPSSFIITEPLGYIDFIKLQSTSSLIITDSGGIQKEAYLLKKPCITLRPETEWIETVQSGWNILLDYRDVDFVDKVRSFKPIGKPPDIFGKNVAVKMVDIIRANCS
jgi:UDP-N-acetylglucosamine 2-epimerase